MPKSNIAPSAANGWNNYQYISTVPQNRWEATGKVDYAISDNTKLTGSYTRQIENDQHPIGVWWTPPWTLPYPSNVVAPTTSQEIHGELDARIQSDDDQRVCVHLGALYQPQHAFES